MRTLSILKYEYGALENLHEVADLGVHEYSPGSVLRFHLNRQQQYEILAGSSAVIKTAV